MFSKWKPVLSLCTASTILIVITAACMPDSAPQVSETAYPASVLATALPHLPETAPAYPSEGESGVLIGPMPFPTPQLQIIPWYALFEEANVQDIHWQGYRGKLQGTQKDQLWSFTFNYPSEWILSEEITPTYIYVQNIYPTVEEVIAEDFAKFEIARLEEPPALLPGQILDVSEVKTVSVSGQRCVLQITTELPGIGRKITVFLERQGVWYALAGYIALPAVDEAKLDRYTAILISMLASFAWQ